MSRRHVLFATPRGCPECHGLGWVRTNTSTNRDPQQETTARCPNGCQEPEYRPRLTATERKAHARRWGDG